MMKVISTLLIASTLETIFEQKESVTMKKLTLAVIVLTLTATSFAAIVPVNPSFNSSTQMPGFNSYLSGSNNQEWWHQWEGNEGHWHKAESTGYYNFNIDQGFMGNQYLPVQTEISIMRWDDDGNFNIRADFKMISPEFLPADYLNTPSGGRNWNAFGLNYNTNISMGHQTGWDWETGEEFITADVTGWFSYNFQDSILIDATDRVGEWQMWGEKGETPDGTRLTAWFNLQYTGKDLDTFNSLVAPVTADYDVPASMAPVPEPATMLLLGLGSLLLRRRRK